MILESQNFEVNRQTVYLDCQKVCDRLVTQDDLKTRRENHVRCDEYE